MSRPFSHLNLASHFHSPILPDITFITSDGTEQIHAHACILATHSPFWYTLIRYVAQQYQQKQKEHINHEEITSTSTSLSSIHFRIITSDHLIPAIKTLMTTFYTSHTKHISSITLTLLLAQIWSLSTSMRQEIVTSWYIQRESVISLEDGGLDKECIHHNIPLLPSSPSPSPSITPLSFPHLTFISHDHIPIHIDPIIGITTSQFISTMMTRWNACDIPHVDVVWKWEEMMNGEWISHIQTELQSSPSQPQSQESDTWAQSQLQLETQPTDIDSQSTQTDTPSQSQSQSQSQPQLSEIQSHSQHQDTPSTHHLNNVIHIPCSHTILMLVVEYMYTGTLSSTSLAMLSPEATSTSTVTSTSTPSTTPSPSTSTSIPSYLLAFHDVCMYLGMTSCWSHVMEQWMSVYMNAENVCDIWWMIRGGDEMSSSSIIPSRHPSDDDDVLDLESICIRYIHDHFLHVVCYPHTHPLILRPSFLKLSVDMLHAILSPGLIDAPDDVVIHIINQWIDYHAHHHVIHHTPHIIGPTAPSGMFTPCQQSLYSSYIATLHAMLLPPATLVTRARRESLLPVQRSSYQEWVE